MKRNILYILLTPVALITIVFGSCNKAVIDRTTSYSALAPSNIDLNAGYLETGIDHICIGFHRRCARRAYFSGLYS